MKLKERFHNGWREVFVVVMLAAITVSMIIMIYYGLFYQNPPIVFNNEPFPVSPTEVYPGGQMTMLVDRCRRTRVPVTIFRTWVNDLSHPQAPSQFGGGEFGCHINLLPVTVPETLPPGEYHINYRFVYEVSAFGTHVVEAVSAPFRVLPADE